jgi:hypothetical protein
LIPDTAFKIHSKPSITPLRLSSDEDDDSDDDDDESDGGDDDDDDDDDNDDDDYLEATWNRRSPHS